MLSDSRCSATVIVRTVCVHLVSNLRWSSLSCNNLQRRAHLFCGSWGAVLECGILPAWNELLFMCLQLLRCSSSTLPVCRLPFQSYLKVDIAMTCSIVRKEKTTFWHWYNEKPSTIGLPILHCCWFACRALTTQSFGCSTAELLEKLIRKLLFKCCVCVISKWLRPLIIGLCPLFEAWQDNLLVNDMPNFAHFKLSPSSVLWTVCENSCQYQHWPNDELISGTALGPD